MPRHVCCVCAKGKSRSKKHLTSRPHIRLLRSEYESAIRVFMRLKPASRTGGRTLASRTPYACRNCYETIRRAECDDAAVVVLPSPMGRYAGRGVLARKALVPGQVVAHYDGATITNEEIPLAQTTSHMRMKNSGEVIDARVGRVIHGGGVGGLCNRPAAGRRPNAKIVNSFNRTTKLDRVVVRVPVKSRGGRPIAPGTEITVSYGNKYTMPAMPRSNAGRPRKRLMPAELTQAFRRQHAEEMRLDA